MKMIPPKSPLANSRRQRELNAKLFRAIRKDDMAQVLHSLDEGSNPSAIEVRSRVIPYFGRIRGACDSALIVAARRGTHLSRTIIEELVKAGANVAYENNWGETAQSILLKFIEELREAEIDSVLLRVLLSSLSGNRSSATDL